MEAVRTADALFSKAESAFSQHDPSAARRYYGTGIESLAATPWYIQDKQCDPPHYTLARYVAALHSLSVAATNNILRPFEAYEDLDQMRKDVWKPFPLTVDGFFEQNYPALHNREWNYIESITTITRPQVLAAHKPSGANCEWRNVNADVLTSVTPNYPRAAYALDAVEVIVTVNLSADGHVVSASVKQSSRDLLLDRASLDAAYASTYLPAVKDCKQVPGSFDFHVTFDPNG